MEEIVEFKNYLDKVNEALSITPNDEDLLKQKSDLEELISYLKESVESNQSAPVESVKTDWKIGDGCQAIWDQDGRYYNGVIIDSFIDGTVKVKFDRYNDTTVCDLKSLKPKMDEFKFGNKVKQRKRQQNKKEYFENQEKVKAARMDEIKEIEKACETERKTWKNFTKKITKKEKFKIAKSKKEERK